MKNEQEKKLQGMKEAAVQGKMSSDDAKETQISESWAEETIADLDDFIESQGIYIRQ